MASVEDLSEAYRLTHPCIGDLASDEDKKKNIHDIRRFSTYPAFPWKMDGTDHSNEDPKFFYRICLNAGVAKQVPREEAQSREPMMSYKEWAAKHPYDNNLKDLFHGT